MKGASKGDGVWSSRLDEFVGRRCLARVAWAADDAVLEVTVTAVVALGRDCFLKIIDHATGEIAIVKFGAISELRIAGRST